jgi:hypothetical protein
LPVMSSGGRQFCSILKQNLTLQNHKQTTLNFDKIIFLSSSFRSQQHKHTWPRLLYGSTLLSRCSNVENLYSWKYIKPPSPVDTSGKRTPDLSKIHMDLYQRQIKYVIYTIRLCKIHILPQFFRNLLFHSFADFSIIYQYISSVQLLSIKEKTTANNCRNWRTCVCLYFTHSPVSETSPYRVKIFTIKWYLKANLVRRICILFIVMLGNFGVSCIWVISPSGYYTSIGISHRGTTPRSRYLCQGFFYHSFCRVKHDHDNVNHVNFKVFLTCKFCGQKVSTCKLWCHGI